MDHSLTPGGRVTYFMTGPEKERHFGYWTVLDMGVEEGTRSALDQIDALVA